MERVGNYLGKTTLITDNQNSNSDLPVIGSLVYCASGVLDHVVTDAGADERLPSRQGEDGVAERQFEAAPWQEAGQSRDAARRQFPQGGDGGRDPYTPSQVQLGGHRALQHLIHVLNQGPAHALLQPHRGKVLRVSAGGGGEARGTQILKWECRVGMSRGASIKEEEEDEEAADCEAGNLMNGDRRAPRDIQGDVESILLMTSNTNAGASWSQLRRLLHRLCRSHRFKNLEVEMLYQRYFLRMNQSNMTHLLGLLLALCLVLGLLQMAAIFVSDPRDDNTLLHSQDNPSIPPEVIAIGMTLTCCITVYGGLMAILSRPALNELYLLGVSYVVLATFLALEMTLTSANERRTPSTGVWAAMFFIYLTYALLPIRLQEAAGAGTLLGVSQVVLSAYLNVENRHLLRQQLPPPLRPLPYSRARMAGTRALLSSYNPSLPPPQPPSTRADNEHEQLSNAMSPLLVRKVPRGPGFHSRSVHIFCEAAGLEQGQLNLVRTTEELLRRSSGSGLEN
uniref:Adenylate cyclase N-terminal domain-containing protein n=1 Tax=Timema douglasi TaxID=61478 RepID=A0A7R8Z3H3_TIMDO|nr:unnamed protein product [Timema douglasi]